VIKDEVQRNSNCSDSLIDGVTAETYKWYLSYIIAAHCLLVWLDTTKG